MNRRRTFVVDPSVTALKFARQRLSELQLALSNTSYLDHLYTNMPKQLDLNLQLTMLHCSIEVAAFGVLIAYYIY